MRKLESDCVGCGLPCSVGCPYYGDKLKLYCDKCGDDVDYLYELGKEEVCLKYLVYNKMKDFIDSVWDDDDFQTIAEEWGSGYEVNLGEEW